MAMQHPRGVVFAGAIGALIVMTVLSVIVGHALPHLLPKILTHWVSILLFVYFGARMLQDARNMYATGEGKGVLLVPDSEAWGLCVALRRMLYVRRFVAPCFYCEAPIRRLRRLRVRDVEWYVCGGLASLHCSGSLR